MKGNRFALGQGCHTVRRDSSWRNGLIFNQVMKTSREDARFSCADFFVEITEKAFKYPPLSKLLTSQRWRGEGNAPHC